MIEVISWVVAVVFLVIVEFIFKAMGLWYAAKKNDKLWFAIMFIFNTAGILPIIYLRFNTDFFCEKKKTKKRR